MTSEELKRKIDEILDANIWFDEGDSFHYEYDDMMEDLLQLFYEYKNS